MARGCDKAANGKAARGSDKAARGIAARWQTATGKAASHELQMAAITNRKMRAVYIVLCTLISLTFNIAADVFKFEKDYANYFSDSL